MNILRRLAAPIALAGIMAATLLVGTAPPASATASDGITIGEFAYVGATNDWLDVTLAGCPSPAPTFVVLNVSTGDIGYMDVVAQAIRSCGIKVYGYVNICASACGTSLAVLRSAYDIDTDTNLWVNPYTAHRTNDDQFIDGIFFDQYPRDCGPIETPTNNTANDADYVLRADQVTDYVHDAFAFWSYPTPLVMANVGTAVRGCHPGWEALSGHVMPDYWVTAENDWDTYEAGWAGGNLLTGGTFGTTYEEGNNYYPNAFVHIVHGAATMADTEAAIDLADARGAASVFVTDDVLANPYDTIPTYEAGARLYASLHPMTLRMSYTNDFVVTQTSSPLKVVIQQARAADCDNPGTPMTVERCPYPTAGVDVIWAAAQAKCGGAGDWGDVDAGLGDPPDSAVVGCFRDMVNDGTGRDDQVCATTNMYDWSDEEADDYVSDCEDPDASGTYLKDATRSGQLRTALAGDYDRAEELLVYLRDWENLLVSGHVAKCITVRDDHAYAEPEYICPS